MEFFVLIKIDSILALDYTQRIKEPTINCTRFPNHDGYYDNYY